jgi:hypothetical protein
MKKEQSFPSTTITQEERHRHNPCRRWREPGDFHSSEQEVNENEEARERERYEIFLLRYVSFLPGLLSSSPSAFPTSFISSLRIK